MGRGGRGSDGPDAVDVIMDRSDRDDLSVTEEVDGQVMLQRVKDLQQRKVVGIFYPEEIMAPVRRVRGQ